MKEIKINVDSYNSDSIKTIQGNNNAEVYKIYVLFNKRRIDLTGKTVKMAYLRTGTVEGDVINLNVTNATEGEITLQITNSISKRDGVYSCQLAIYGADGFLEHTATFGLTVEANIFNTIASKIVNSKDLTYIESILEQAKNTSEELKTNIPVATNLNSSLESNISNASNINTTLADTTEKSKVAATDAIEKKSQLDSSITKAKEFIDGLDGSQNIPQIRLDVTELQNGLKSNQALEYSGSSISANDTLEGRTEGMRIKGRTLRNLVEISTFYGAGTSTRVVEKTPTSYKITNTKVAQNLSMVVMMPSKLIKPSTEYTIIFKCESNLTGSISLSFKSESSYGEQLKDIQNKNGFNIINIASPNKEVTDIVIGNHSAVKLNEFIKIEEVIVLEGNWTNKSIPFYFEGIKSFGEAEYNLLDESQISIGYIGGSDGITYSVPDQDDGTRIAIIPCDPNTTYTITKEFITDRFIVGTTIERPVHAMKVNKLSQQDNSKNITITTPGDAKYLLAYLTLDNKNKPCGKVNINKSNVPVEWSVPGKYNISILSNGANLLDENSLSSVANDIITYNKVFIRNNSTININTYGKEIKRGRISLFDYYGKEYLIKDWTNSDLNINVGNIPTGFYKIKFWQGKAHDSFNNAGDKRVMVYEGSEIMNYQPYIQDKKDILISAPLRSVDDVQDIMFESEGKVKVTRNVDTYTFTGDETMRDTTDQDEKSGTGKYKVFALTVNKTIDINKNINNNFPKKNFSVEFQTMDSEGLAVTQYGIYIKILKSKLSTQDTEGLKSWLKANTTTIYFARATPVTEIVENCIDIDLDTFQDKTYFNILNSLPGTLDFKVPSNIGSVVQNMAKEVNNIWDVINNLLVPNIVKANGNLAMLKLNNNLN